MVENLVEIGLEQLLDHVAKAERDEFRFVTATTADAEDGKFDITYHFDKNFEMRNFRVTVGREDEIPSISSVFLCAVLVENELTELFGLKVAGMAIDYGGHFILSGDDEAPLARNQIIIEQRGGKK